MTDASTTLEGMLLLPEAPDLDWDQASGIAACSAPVATGLSSLAAALEDGPAAAAPDSLHYLRCTRRALLEEKDPQLIAAWRGALAICLLTDSWLDGADLTAVSFTGDSTFASAVLSGQEEATITLAVLQQGGRRASLGVIVPDLGLVPAAQAEDLSNLLPPRATWYSKEQRAFSDPTEELNERDRLLLLQRLNLLAPCEAVQRFAADLNHAALRPAQAAARQDENMLRVLSLRMQAVLGLGESTGVKGLTQQVSPYRDMSVNPLLSALGVTHIMESSIAPQVTWLWQGIPFARSHSMIGWESTGHPQEEEALQALEETLGLLQGYSLRWNRSLAESLSKWLTLHHDDRALSPALRTLAEQTRQQALAFTAQESLRLTWPWQGEGSAVWYLWQEALGDSLDHVLACPFADKLCLISGGAYAVLGDAAFSRSCALPPTEDSPACAVIPPLSAALAQAVASAPEGRYLVPESFAFSRQEDSSITVSMTLMGENTVHLQRAYAPQEQRILSMEDVPTLAMWPALPLPEKTWQAYYVYLRGGLQAQALENGRWISTQDRLFSVIRTRQFPAMLLLRDGEACLGAVPNLLPACQPPRADAAQASVNLGASGTSMALMQGEHIEPLRLPGLVRTLLQGARPAPLAAEFLPAQPLGPVLPAAVELFGSMPRPDPLVDGHMLLCDGQTMAGLQAKQLFCDLKWSNDDVSRTARGLYLRQLMLMISLAAVLRGAPSISWRIALPEGMSAEGRRHLWQDMADLAPLVAEDSGLPLTITQPILLHGDETMALGAYLRGDGGVRGGFLAMDTGSGGTSMALWLRGMNRPAMRCQIPLGVQAMLLGPLIAAPEHLEADFYDLSDPAAHQAVTHLAAHLRAASGSRKAFDKARLMLDALLGEHFPALCAHMNTRFAMGQITTMQSLLVCGLTALITLAGLMQEQVWRDPLLNDYLPADLLLLTTGRGCQLLNALPETFQARLPRFLRLMMSGDHPVRNVRMAPSHAPKSDVALGMLRMKEVSSLEPDQAVSLRPSAGLPLPPAHLLMRYLGALAQEFPYPCARLYLHLFDEYGLLTAEAESMITSAAARHFTSSAQPEAAFAACLSELCVLESLLGRGE